MTSASPHNQEMLEELEGHLREEVDRLLGSGVSEDTVFQIALSNLGSPNALGTEFDKLNPGRGEVWMPVKIARVVGVGLAVLVCVLVIPWMGNEKGVLLATHTVGVTLGYLTMFIIGGLAGCSVYARWFSSLGPMQQRSLLRAIFQFANIAAILTSIAILLGMVWARDHLGRYWAWDPKETGGLAVLGWAGLISAARYLNGLKPTMVVFVGILANIITAWAWFGTSMRGGYFQSSPVLGVFMAIQFVVLLASVVPASTVRRHRAKP